MVAAPAAVVPASASSHPATLQSVPSAMTVTAGERMVVIGPPVTTQGNEIRRAPDGLFYVTAIVNGAPVRFLVDTGATVIVLTREDARRAGLGVEDADFSASAQTANGQTSMAKVTLDEVVVGETRKQALSGAVVRENLAVSLLGQSWLSQLASLTISGDRMLFN